ISQPTRVQMYSYLNLTHRRDSVGFNFYVQPQRIIIKITNEFKNIVINEPQTEADRKLLTTRKVLLQKRKDSIYNALSILRERHSEKYFGIQNLLNDFDSVILKEIAIEIDFIKFHKNSFLSLELLRSRVYRNPELPSIDSINKLYNSLSAMVKYSPAGDRLNMLIQKVIKTGVGQPAPYFHLRDMYGRELNKDSFRNKLVLLDFWASWCVPCRNDFPSLKELYKKYSDKGFEIISVSTDRDTSAYAKAIKEDGINIWVNALKNDQIMNQYHVPAIPIKYLINKDGLIIKRRRGGGEENMDELRKALEDFF
ncbi:MAG TPA: TlpA disulfide reductase family protein, partial [Hanamia sp.]|nr:TlpA disulfide reductase family protein [Hanamia sp.]